MKQRHFISARCLGLPLLTAAALSSVLLGCAQTSKPPAKKPSTQVQAAQAANAADAAVGSVKGSISLEALDGAGLRLNMLGVAPYSFGRHRFPIVSFSFPPQADYVQVLRCRADANLGELGNIEIGASNTKQADAIYQSKDFWQRTASNPFCAYITTGTSNDKVIDFYANSGDYVYVARACVEKSRLAAADPDALSNGCTRQVGKTTEFRGHVNVEKNLTFEVKEKMRAQRDKVDAMGREFVYLAKLTDSQISDCEKQRGATKASRYRRESLGKIIGVGIDLGAKLLSDGLAKSILGGLSGFSGIFNEISARSEDYLPPEFCPGADLSMARMKQLKEQLEVESKDYNERLKTYGEP
ncbi:MAG: hypothetical protein RI932_590 [Pseudomonadota bacterium]|jgi:hypothetical protein